MRLTRKLLYSFLFLFLFSCVFFSEVYIRLYYNALSFLQPPDTTYIKDKMWSYDGGFRVGGDFIIFKDSHWYRLKGDTIYYRDTPKALVIRLNKYLYQMTVSSLDRKQAGTYTNVEEHLQ